MIDLYTFTTPNGRKPSIMLEEVGVPYVPHVVHIGRGEQNAPAFRAINPNGKIPALRDSDGPSGSPVTVFESGAILIYLAEKTGKLLPREGVDRYAALQWLMFQMGGVGPMLGQLGHFLHYAPERVPYAVNRYATETKRIYGVLEARLSEAEYLAGAYSIADIATYPWIAAHAMHEIDLSAFPSVKRWHDAVGARPAVKRGMAVPVVPA